MRRSRNEVITLLRKAAIGCGFPAGLADDTARAGLWLSALGCEGAEAVLSSIRAGFSVQPLAGREGEVLIADRVCVAAAGPGLLDLLMAGSSVKRLVFNQPDSPLLLAGLAGVAGEDHKCAFVLRGEPGVEVLLPGCSFRDLSRFAKDLVTFEIVLDRSKRFEKAASQAGRPLDVADAVWQEVAELAAQTHVPASAASRATGAGAGLLDND